MHMQLTMPVLMRSGVPAAAYNGVCAGVGKPHALVPVNWVITTKPLNVCCVLVHEQKQSDTVHDCAWCGAGAHRWVVTHT